MKLPQSLDPQVAAQSTPLVLLTGDTDAARGAEASVSIVAGKFVDIVIVTGVAEVTVAVDGAAFVGSAVDFAVIVIAPPTGTVELFVNVAAAPLDVCPVMLPQFDVLQLKLQSIPAPDESFDTIAVTWAERYCPVC